jgi:hypothetical protein
MAVTYQRYYEDRTDLLRVKVFPLVECIVPNTVGNRKGISVFLRSLYEEKTGKHMVSLPELSRQLGYEDRRNTHNFWGEFQASGYDFQVLMERRRKVSNKEVVEFMQEQWEKDVGVTIKEMKQRIEKRFSIKVTESSVRKASEWVEVLPILKAVYRQLEKGQRSYKYQGLLKQVFFEVLRQNGSNQPGGDQEFDWSQTKPKEVGKPSANQNPTL